MPILRRLNIPCTLVHLILCSVAAILLILRGVDFAVLYVVWGYALLGILLKRLFSRYHRKGIRLYRKKQFDSAIAEFEKSRDYFSSHVLIDRFRCITLMSLSRYSYREMALMNIAFCKTQTGKGSEARDLYKQILDEFPGNLAAESSLRMLESL